MPAVDIPLFGSLVLCLTLVMNGYTFAMAVAAGRGRRSLLAGARFGTYATCALVVLAVCLLAFAFQTHDYRLSYVARYSDRSMSWWYLFTSLWGGQDGSLLWWSFLLCGYSGAFVYLSRDRHLELQPWVIAILMSILGFFLLLMLFAANPFATFVAATPVEGEGLNPLLQNYWMSIHPPTLYLGFVGWSVPLAICVAALITGRLTDEWVHAARRWAMVSWLFLSIGLTLGMLWSYEELGWGGYWAWDPVENASLWPWLAGTAYIHSAIVQERYGMLKIWNIFLLCLTFWLTIYATFVTRAGLISSVHSFARSDIGIWFAWYLVFLFLACFFLLLSRVSQLKADNRFLSLASREFAFLFNNWILLVILVLVFGLTMYPLITEWTQGEQATVGPSVYNHLVAPFGFILLFLTGVGPILSWRKATGRNLLRAFVIPCSTASLVLLVHALAGNANGYPPYVEVTPIFDSRLGVILAEISGYGPVIATTICAFVIATVLQEFWRGTRVRMRKGEAALEAFFTLAWRARRRYGGYIVHLGIVSMFFGWTGAAYDVEREAALYPGEQMETGNFIVRYAGPRSERDRNKRMIFADLDVMDRQGDPVGEGDPAKFIYHTHPEMPTTEVSIRSRPDRDLYMIMSTVDPQSQRGTFRIIERPFVLWIWFGGLLLVLGAGWAMLPRVEEILQGARAPVRSASRYVVAGLIALLLLLIPTFAFAQNDESSSLHAGTVEMQNDEERLLFGRLLCRCGDCPRLPLDSCGCSWAENARAKLRVGLAEGTPVNTLIEEYASEHGMGSIAVIPDEGVGRVVWAAPVLGAVLFAGLLFYVGRRWKRAGDASGVGRRSQPSANRAKPDPVDPSSGERYEGKLDEELKRLDE